MEYGTLTGNFAKDVNTLDAILRVGESFDFIRKPMQIDGNDVVLYYLDGFIKGESLQKLLTHLVSVKAWGDSKTGAAARFAAQNVTSAEVDVTNEIDKLVLFVMSGCAILLSSAFDANALILDLRSYPARNAEEPENDKVMRGSRDGFVETLLSNISLIRRRIRTPQFTVKYLNVGKSTRTDVALCYLDGKADHEYVKDLTNRIAKLDTDSLVLGHQSMIESLLRKRWYNPFPKVRSTERPDAAAATILEGGVIVLIDNSPEAMIFPTSIFDFLQETDDYYFPPITGTYLRLLRHLIFWLTAIATPFWYGFIMSPDLLPDWLSFLIPKDAGEIPIFVQLILTEFAIDGLKLASLNTPSVMSNSLSVVGGLLLGDFAVTVGWLSPDVILYMAFVAIANFTQSNYELAYALKYVRILTLTLTALFHWWGFLAGNLIAFLLVVTNETADGKRRYLYPFIPFNGKALVRLLFRLKKNDFRGSLAKEPKKV